MKIHSDDKTVHDVFKSNYFSIPKFQRPYSWDKENVEELWNDAIVGPETEYFIGSLVLFVEKSGVFGIVDGQQRLTTLTMFLCALRDALDDEGHEGLASGTHALIERPDINSKPTYVLSTETSYPYFQEYIQKRTEHEVEVTPGPEEEKLSAAFTVINRLISNIIDEIRKNSQGLTAGERSNRVKDRLIGLRDRVLALKLIVIDLDNEDDAYTIFETLNTRGKDLTPSDLVKNHLHKLIKTTNKNVDTTKLKWRQVLETLSPLPKDLDIDSFLHHHWLSENEYTSEKKLFKSIKKSISTREEATEFLNGLTAASKNYKAIVTPSSAVWSKDERAIKELLTAISLFRFRQPLPFLLALLREHRQKPKSVKTKHITSALRAVEAFHFMNNSIAAQSSSGGISAMYASAARGLHAAKTANAKIQTINQIIKKLSDRKPPRDVFVGEFVRLSYSDEFPTQKTLIRHVLSNLDRAAYVGIKLDYEQMTIEHISPQNASGSQKLSPSDVANIGNLLLVDGPTNVKLANKNFSDKKKILEASSVKMDQVLAKATTWTSKHVADRARALAELAYDEIWDY